MRAARFGAALAMLWAAHDLADHVVQTDYQAANKASSWTAMAGHVGSYTAVQLGSLAALSALTGERATWGRTVAAVAFSAVSHAFLDRRWPVWRALELTGSPEFAKSRVQAERELLVCQRHDEHGNTDRYMRDAGLALFPVSDCICAGNYVSAGNGLSRAVHSTVTVIDPEHPTGLHGPYLADQALHHACLTVCAAILAGGDR